MLPPLHHEQHHRNMETYSKRVAQLNGVRHVGPFILSLLGYSIIGLPRVTKISCSLDHFGLPTGANSRGGSTRSRLLLRATLSNARFTRLKARTQRSFPRSRKTARGAFQGIVPGRPEGNLERVVDVAGRSVGAPFLFLRGPLLIFFGNSCSFPFRVYCRPLNNRARPISPLSSSSSFCAAALFVPGTLGN